MHVVVIGGGACGVSAATKLTSRGISCTLLEARETLGGRVRSTYLTKNLIKVSSQRNHVNGANGTSRASDGFDRINGTTAIDTSVGSEEKVLVHLGANWLHGLNPEVNPLYAVACELGLELHVSSSDDEPGDDVLLFDPSAVDKTPMSRDDYNQALQRYHWIRAYMQSLPIVDKSLTLEDTFHIALEASCAESAFGPVSPLHRACVHWCMDRVAIDNAAPLTRINPSAYLEEESPGAHGEAIVRGGLLPLLTHIALSTPLDIRLQHTVHSIHSTPSAVRIDYTSHGTRGFLSCDYCLVTLPIGALQAGAIEFLPQIPPHIAPYCDAAHIRSGLMNIVWLWYPHQFWPEEGVNYLGVLRREMDPDESTFTTFMCAPMFDTTGRKQPVLMCQLVGGYADKVESLTEEAIAADATAVLRRLFGASVVPDAIGCLRSSWASDEFARGSWAYHPVLREGHQEWEEAIEATERVLYAGEATSAEHPGTVHGAHMEGIRAAERIITAIGEVDASGGYIIETPSKEF